jgi:hypothetical protein
MKEFLDKLSVPMPNTTTPPVPTFPFLEYAIMGLTEVDIP